MPRRLVLVVFCAAVLAGGFDEQYRKAIDAEARRAAIRALAAQDDAAAAERLLRLWRDLDTASGKLRKQLLAGRKKLTALEVKKRKATRADARQKLADQILRAAAQDVLVDKRIAGIDREKYAILAGLRGMRSAATREWLAAQGVTRAASPVLLRAVARVVAAGAPDLLLPVLARERRPKRLIALLQGLGHASTKRPGRVDEIAARLGNSDWAVRAAAGHALAHAAQPQGVGPLIAALAKEKKRSRGQFEIARALRVLTGQKLGPFPDLWQLWWRDHRVAVEAGKTPLGKGSGDTQAKPDQGNFYGIPQDFDRIIYVFDKSGSMVVSMDNPRYEEKAPVPAYDDEDSRFDAAVRELLRATKRLRRGSSFCVILYSDRAQKVHDKLVPASKDEHAKLANTMARQGAAGSTNIYEALDVALRMANVHAHSTRGEQRADVIFLVSDGSPTNPKGESEDPERTLQAVSEWNAAQRVTIHCIGIGQGHNSVFLKELAGQNGGEYYAVLPAKKKNKKPK